MTDPSGELVALCERWRESVGVSSLKERAQSYMRLLGWEDCAFEVRSNDDVVTVAVAPDGISLLFCFAPPGALDSPVSVQERSLDFCVGSRERIVAARSSISDYVLITDFSSSYLYDVETDELLLSSDTPKVFLTTLYDEVTKECVDTGSLREIRRNPRSYLGRQLREWCQRWAETLERIAGVAPEVTEVLTDRLVVLRFLALRELERKGASGVRNRLSVLGDRARGATPDGCGRELSKLFQGMYASRRIGLFRPSEDLETLLKRDDLVAPIVSEFMLLSEAKFTIATVLESFNFGDAAEKARVRLVPGKELDRERVLDEQTLACVDRFQIEIDIVEEGYRAIGFWLDKLVTLYRRLAVVYEAGDACKNAEGDAVPIPETRPLAICDVHRFAVKRGLRIYFATERQYRTARLLFYLYVIQSYARHQEAFAHFPMLEDALAQRPTLLESEKKWLYQPPPDHASRGWDVV